MSCFRLVEAEKAEHRVSRLCRVLGVTRQGYYAWRRRRPSKRQLADRQLSKVIREVFVESRQTHGAPRVHAELREAHGQRVGRKRVARLMRESGLQGVSRRGRRRRMLPASGPAAPPAPDLVRRRFHAEQPDQLWLADITYVPTWEGWLFLAVVMDVCTRQIVGWSMREDVSSELVVDALGMAVARRRPNGQVIHHSDRGSQYASLAFGRTLRESGLAASMGSRGDPYDNAMCESVVSTIKQELLNRRSWKTRDDARLAVFSYIETFYNPSRRHSALDHLSPDEYEKIRKRQDPEHAVVY